MFTRLLVAHCLLPFSLSRHGPFIVRCAQLFHRSNSFNQLLHPSRLSQYILWWSVGSMVSRIPCKLAMLLSYRSRDWLRSNICTNFGCKHLLDTEISILNSFLYTQSFEYQCVSFVVLLLIDPSKNLPLNCHFALLPSLEFPDPCIWISRTVQLDLASPLRGTPLLPRSSLSSFEVWIQISLYGSHSAQLFLSYFLSSLGHQRNRCPSTKTVVLSNEVHEVKLVNVSSAH